MRMSSVLFAGALVALAGPSEAAQCARFPHSYAPFGIEFVGGTPEMPVTSRPILLVGITVFPSSPRTPRKFARSHCGPQGYICYRSIADAADTFIFKVEQDPGGPDGGTMLVPPHDDPGRLYYVACKDIQEHAEEDARMHRPAPQTR